MPKKTNITDFKNMSDMLREAKSVAITMHVRPDGDSIGTAAALRLSLLRRDKSVDVYCDGEIPEQLFSLQGIDTFIVHTPPEIQISMLGKKTSGEDVIPEIRSDYDLLIVVDAGEKHRLGVWSNLSDRCTKTLVFDHHLNPTMQADTTVSNPMRASCGEMLFEFFTTYKSKITRQMAEALYTAVSSDTGCFLFPNTTAYTHYTASELMKIGIDVASINYSNFRVYDPKTLGGLMEVLRQLKFISDGRIAITYLDYRLVRRYDFDHDTRHKFQRYASDAQGVKVSIFLTEQERENFNISLRSHGDVNVAAIAKHFGGGGHKNAAGITMKGRYKDVIKQIVDKVEETLDKD